MPDAAPVDTLDGLRAGFPGHRITETSVNGLRFYVAEAAAPGVRPEFAQAQSAERLRAKLTAPEPRVDSSRPSVPRVYDVLLGGTENFPADREQAAAMLEVFPHTADVVRHSRWFQSRAVGWLAGQGVGQFLDLGCGLPTAPNTHESARAVRPDARTVYVDNDGQVLAQARDLLSRGGPSPDGGTGGLLVCDGDLAWPAEILYDQRIRAFLDFTAPIAVILAMTMHFFTAEQAQAISREIIGALPAGSYVVMSVAGGDDDLTDDLADAYTTADVHSHGAPGLTRFLDGLDLAEPGIVQARYWHNHASAPADLRGDIWAVVARKP